MRFLIGEKGVEPLVSLTLSKDEEESGLILLKANGERLMGFRNGTYRLYSDAFKKGIKGLEYDDATGFLKSYF